MNKEEHIKYWVESSGNDFDAAMDLFNSGKYLHCMFFIHLSIEKICKAHWVKDNSENYPPKVHNLIYLLKQTTTILTDDQTDFLTILNDFQLEGRYPDYQQNIKKYLTLEKTSTFIAKTKEIRSWLLSKLQ